MRKIVIACMLILTILALPISATMVENNAVYGVDKTSYEAYATADELLKAGYISGVDKTEGNPFMENVGGSKNFRIPALITLKDGSLLAVADARYETTGDGGGLDTIIALSKDNGKNWEQSYAIMYPDSERYAEYISTTCIDPAVVQANDGTIHIIVDMNPTGVTTMGGYTSPNMGTGYMLVDGKQRLALTDNYEMVNTNPQEKAYPYYLADMVDGYANVVKTEGNIKTDFYLDGWWNIYKKQGDKLVELTQKQVDSNRDVQQNAYYKGSCLHVYNTGYMLMVSSKDNGKTWSPRVLNTEIKKDNEKALLVSPGKGTVAKDGTIIIPFYTFDRKGNQIVQQASFIWSKDNGETWNRTQDAPNNMFVRFSSESEIVEVNNNTLRMFVRNGRNKIVYIDANWDENSNNYIWSYPVETNVPVWSNCNLTALSLEIDGKLAVMVACPSKKSRQDGKIYTFLLDENNNMTVPKYEYSVNTGDYAYSCMDILQDGTIGLLYEAKHGTMEFINITVDELTKNAYVNKSGTVAFAVSIGVIGAVMLVAVVIKLVIKKKENK